ncbi:hypothetical protein [Cysteiniphilum marinum]|nr:hypothetical protein [Cysteiniphilum marinum]
MEFQNKKSERSKKMNSIKKLAMMSVFAGAMVGVVGCGGGGGSAGVDTSQPNSEDITIKLREYTPSVAAIRVENQGGTNTGTLFFDYFSDDNYEIYDGVSDTSYCTPVSCFRTCKSGEFITSGGACYIYINAKKTLEYKDDPIVLEDAITITNIGKVYKFNINIKGQLFALNNNRLIEKSKDSSDWRYPQYQGDFSYGLARAMSFDNNGVMFVGNTVGEIISMLPIGSKHYGKPTTTNDPINTVAFNSNNTPYVGSEGSNQIYKFESGNWVSTGTPDSVLTSIKNIAFFGDDNMVVQGNLPSLPSFYIRNNNAWQNVGMPLSSSLNVLGFAVDNTGKIHTSLQTRGDTFSYTNQWSSGDGNVVDSSSEVRSLIADKSGNLYAAVGTEVYEKTSGSNWVSIGSPNSYSNVTSIAQGVKVTVTQNI